MRSEEEKQEVIEKLEESKKSIPEHNAFGDPNHEIIDSQIDVIKRNLSEDAIYDLEAELGEGNHMSALEALWWLRGEKTTEEFIESMT